MHNLFLGTGKHVMDIWCATFKEEMKTLRDLCTVSSSLSTPRSQVKIPPVVSVSLAGKVDVSC